MTSATSTKAAVKRRGKLYFWDGEFWSAANMVRLMDMAMDAVAIIVGGLTRNIGIAALLVADSFAGGYVLSRTLSSEPTTWVTIVAICISLGTTALTIMLWESVLSGRFRQTKLVPLLFVLAIMPFDILLDLKFVTLLQYGVDAARATLIVPPNADWLWKLETGVCGMLTTCGELGIVFLRRRRKTASAESMDAHTDDALAIATP
jgi:hypothetical protein